MNEMIRGGGTRLSRTQAQQGFTLVEMAIVLVIIGLIVGGILKGEEIVNNGRVKTQVAQIDSVKAAVSTFQDIYGFFPGDFKASQQFVTATTWDGNEDGIVNDQANVGTVAADNVKAGNEMSYVWVQMTYANLLGGATINGAASTAAAQFPGKMPGSFLFFGDFSYASANPNLTAAGTGITNFGGKFVRIQTNADITNAPTPAIRGTDAAQIDKKYDDGVPSTGTILAGQSSTTGCCTGGACLSAVSYVSGTAANSGLTCVLLWQAN